MRWGFDLDGTLDHLEIRNLANFLFDQGEEVHVLTGFVPGGSYTAVMKAEKLQRLGCRYTRLHLCEGQTMEEIGYAKSVLLNRHGIALMVDDDPTFLKQMAYYSRARLLMVVR